MKPRDLTQSARADLRCELIELQSRYDLTYRQLQRYVRREYGIHLSRSGMFHFLN